MRQLLSPAQRAASALRKAEKALRDWQDDPDSPRADVDKMLAIVGDLRQWVQGHVLADIERTERLLRERAARTASAPNPPPSSPGGD
ncbi:MAG TPA: hypothetical protein VFB38_17590 [Chthonomonadaceae bacterium]|nr:hypothetical protein [Chthonomonadaceae bacterium]